MHIFFGSEKDILWRISVLTLSSITEHKKSQQSGWLGFQNPGIHEKEATWCQVERRTPPDAENRESERESSWAVGVLPNLEIPDVAVLPSKWTS